MKARFILCLIGLLLTVTSQADPILQKLQGGDIPFSSLKGKWVLINYWASWCDTCIREIPELNAFYQSHQKQVALFAVNYDRLPASKQQMLIKKFDIRYPSLSKDPRRELELGDITGVPITFVFNPQGELVKELPGGQSASSLEEALKN